MRLLPCLILALAVLCLAAAPASAAGTLRLVDPITDNYKASFNSDPSVPERRTWLAMRDLSAGGTTWRPSEPADISFEAGDFTVNGADGRTGTLAIRSFSGPIDSRAARIDPTHVESGGRWGPFIEIQDRDLLRSTPIVLDLTLSVDGVVLATGRISYRYDAAFGSAPAGHIEHNGPGGRWWVGAFRTRANWEPAPSTAPTLVAAYPPRITSVVVPRRTTRRVISMRVSGRRGTARITHVRVSVAGRPYGRWVRTRARYSLVLPRGNTTRAVRVQLRDALGLRSSVVTRRVRCIC